jgi:hypothetical protein
MVGVAKWGRMIIVAVVEFLFEGYLLHVSTLLDEAIKSRVRRCHFIV